MPEHQQTQQPKITDNTSQKQTIPPKQIPTSHPAAIIQRARINPKSLTPANVLQLQRTIGNRAVGRLLSEIGLIPSNAKQASPVQMQTISEEEEPLQGKFSEPLQRQEIPEEEEEPLQGKFENDSEQEACPSCSIPLIQKQEENRTGMTDNLKAGVESLSGIDISDVRVHYNSDKPAEVGALAYTQGTDIHVASGQEKYLPHEAWHVVQQAQGRVRPTMQLKDFAINDDVGLEREADIMGDKALYKKLNYKSNDPKTLKFEKSIFNVQSQKTPQMSINEVKSIPIQRVKWKAFFDETSGKQYYQNLESGTTQWNKPDDYTGNWEKKLDTHTGNVYFYNAKTNTSQWKIPDDYDGPAISDSEKWKKFTKGDRAYYTNYEESKWEVPLEIIENDKRIANSIFSPYLQTHKVGDWIHQEDEAGREIRKQKGSVEFSLAIPHGLGVEKKKEYWAQKGKKYSTQVYKKHKDKIPLWCDESAAIIVAKLKAYKGFRSQLDIVKKGNPQQGGHWYVLANRHPERQSTQPPELFPGEFIIDIWGALFLNERLNMNLDSVVFTSYSKMVDVPGKEQSVLSLNYDE